MNAPIKIQLLLTEAGRSPNTFAQLNKAMMAAGITVTGRGRFSVSAKIDQPSFERVFGCKAPSVVSGFSKISDFKAVVPKDMESLVSQVTVVPRHDPMA